MRPWFPWYPTDYSSATKFISPMADLVYRRLLDQYWMNEGPLPLNYAALARSIGLDTRVVKRYLTTELADFWEVIKTDDGTVTPIATPIATYVAAQQLQRSKQTSDALLLNKRMQAEIEISHEKHELAKKAGKIGGLAKAKANAIANALAMSQSQSHKDISRPHTRPCNIPEKTEDENETPEPTKNKPKRNAIPYQQIVDLYHELLPELPRCETITTKRKGQIAARHRDLGGELRKWGNFFKHIRMSEFLMGKTQPVPGRKQFKATLEWVTNESNFAKISEDQYHG